MLTIGDDDGSAATDPHQAMHKHVLALADPLINELNAFLEPADDVLIIHVDASLFSNTHCLLTTGVMIAELNHHVNRIQTVVA